MPTVLREAGFDFCIRIKDHGPPHVHILKAGAQMKVGLGDAALGPYVIRVRGMKIPESRRAFVIVEREQEMLLKRWAEFHGT